LGSTFQPLRNTGQGAELPVGLLNSQHVAPRRRQSPDAAREPLSLLVVTPRFHPLSGGVENHVFEVGRRLRDLGVDVTVLTTDVSGELPPAATVEGIRVERVRAWPSGRDYHFAPGIMGVVRRGRWDVVHVQSYHTFVAPLAMFAALRARVPYILTFHAGGHSSRVRAKLRRFQRRLLRPLLARSARLVAVASFEVQLYARELRLPASSFAVIPNGSDLVDTADSPPDPLRGAPLIVSVGRLERYKGHQRVLMAFPEVVRRRPDARLWIAGTGPYEPELRRLASGLGVADAVEIRGIPLDQRRAMATELARASLVCLLSEFETQPIAALEALALGRRLLVADTTGLRELASEGRARTIALESNPGDIAAAILEAIASDPPHPVANLPTWDACAAALLALYRDVLEARCAS
jgi:glycosyltransferase involved in cell wall biosynthesis